MKFEKYMSAFDRLCADVEEQGVVRKRQYTYRIFATDEPWFRFILRAENDSVDRAKLLNLQQAYTVVWELYAVKKDSGVWKKIVLLDVYN